MNTIVFFLSLLIATQVLAIEVNLPVNKVQQIEIAIKDLSERQQMTGESEILLKSIQDITWPSGALGCLKPGRHYTQALVPGVLILLIVKDKTYRYHAKSQSPPFYCADKFAQKFALPDSSL